MNQSHNNIQKTIENFECHDPSCDSMSNNTCKNLLLLCGFVKLTSAPANITEISKLLELGKSHDFFSEYSDLNLTTIFVKETVKLEAKKYPVFYNIRKILRMNPQNSSHLIDDAITQLIRLTKPSDKSADFTIENYYRHVLSITDSIIDAIKKSLNEKNNKDSVLDLINHEIESEHDFINGEHGRKEYLINDLPRWKINSLDKLYVTAKILDGTLKCGDLRRASTGRKRTHRSNSKNNSREKIKNVFKPEEPELDNPVHTLMQNTSDGISISDKNYFGNYAYDRHQLKKYAAQSFAHRNIVTSAKMSALSVITHSNILIHAFHKACREAYSLIWLAAITGVDITREIVFKRPTDDSIAHLQYSKQTNTLRYHVFSRKYRHDKSFYLTVGEFELPLPDYVAKGIHAICSNNSQIESIEKAQALMKNYSRTHRDDTPTFNRLRAGARVHFIPLGISELNYSAIRGQTDISVQAISAYQPAKVSHIQKQFLNTYKSAHEKWSLPDELLINNFTIQNNNTIFSSVYNDDSLLKDIFHVISEDYKKACVLAKYSTSIADKITPIEIFELAIYMLQELGAGIRPAGIVVNISYSGGIAIKYDKGQHFSISSLSWKHQELIKISKYYRELLNDIAYDNNLTIRIDKNRRELAQCFSLKKDILTITSMSGSKFRKQLFELKNAPKLPAENNVFRHMTAEYLAQSKDIPQSLIDEFLGHHRLGMEPLGLWSSSDLSDINLISEALNSWHEMMIPKALTKIYLLD